MRSARDALSNIVDQSKEAGQSIEDEVISKIDSLEEDKESSIEAVAKEGEKLSFICFKMLLAPYFPFRWCNIVRAKL